MIRSLSIALGALLLMSGSAQAEQVTAASATQQAGRYLGNALWNGTNTECLIFANPVLAVGPFYGLINVNGALMYGTYFQCHELVGGGIQPPVYPQPPRPPVNPGPPYPGAGFQYGAIAYRVVARSQWNAAYYQVGMSSNHTDANRAAYDAQLDCGQGCGYFTFANSCAGIAFTRLPNGEPRLHGYLTRTEPGTSQNSRERVRNHLERECNRQRVTCEDVRVICSND